jgi:hypothetical protein
MNDEWTHLRLLRSAPVPPVHSKLLIIVQYVVVE